MLVSSFNIIATLTLIVNSKKKEIAILKSLGFTKNRIRKIFMFKGFIIGIIGIILGTITGLSATYFLSKYTMNADVYYIQKLPVRVNPSEVIIIVLVTIVITLLATIIPASRAANITPVYGLKGK
jgi:lipoprotein-releasing system permease protein